VSALVPNATTSLLTTLLAESWLAERQFLPEHRNVFDVPSWNSKCNIFKNRSRLQNLASRQTWIRKGASPYVRCATANTNINIMDRGKETTKQMAVNFCWMRSNLLASEDVIEFQTPEAHWSLNLTQVKYNNMRTVEEGEGQCSYTANCTQQFSTVRKHVVNITVKVSLKSRNTQMSVWITEDW
jgi:hypothetical protein